MGLYRLTCASTSCHPDRDQLADILDRSGKRNHEAFVSGMLLIENGFFLQLLEGERAVVTSRFLEVAREGYHRDIEILQCGPINSRYFSDWEAIYLGSQGKAAKTVKRYQGGPQFNPYKLTAANVESLCMDMAGFSRQA